MGLSRRGYQRRHILQLAQAVRRDGSVSVVGDAESREREYAIEEDRRGTRTRQADPQGKSELFKAQGLTTEQLRQAVIHTRQKFATSKRRTCRVVGLARSSLEYQPAPKDDDALRLALIRLAKQYGRYGYRKIAVLLRIEGWKVNHKKVERIWREEGLQLPQRHKKRRRLYHQDSSIIRLRPTHPNHVWAIDFVHDKLDGGRSYKMLTVLDEYTRQALAVTVRTRMTADDVLEALYPLLLRHGTPEYIRSDNGPEFIAQAMQDWLARVGIKPIRIYPGSPWENGYNERFNGTLRREVLNAEWFTTTKQAQVAINRWLRQYNHIRPHQALNMLPPVPETLIRNGPEYGG
ncbi:MAG: IS3 family transposase [Alphaproteobacteria bacterium]|nr:IS3 family transposase [Alphaproteobacteria bacterium]